MWEQWRREWPADKGGPLLQHSGMDWNAAVGTQLYAAIPGEATTLEVPSTFGKSVRVRGTSSFLYIAAGVDFFGPLEWSVNYYHLNAYVGAFPRRVRAGDLLGYSGQSGAQVKGAHLHHTVYVFLRGRWLMVDPWLFYPELSGTARGEVPFLLQDNVDGKQVRLPMYPHTWT